MSAARTAAAVVLVVIALVLAACGGSSGGSSSESGSATTVSTQSAPTKRVVLSAQGQSFDPEAIYRSAAPGVVTVLSIFPGGSLSSILGGGGGSAAEGSGFVISDNGEIATNAHVVTDADQAGASGPIHEAKEVYVEFGDRNRVRADVVGFDPNADVALLKVDPAGLDLKPLTLAANENVTVGQPVAAIGSPFEQEQSLSVGVVSATDRSIESLTRFQIEGAIQTDASINPGNSGGPLLDADAHVIGINQQISTTSGGNEGVGFAVPIELAAHSLDELRSNGEVKYAYIGVTTEPIYPQLADRLNLPTDSGALIAKVVPDGPADQAGLQGSDQQIRFQGQQVDAGGDVITAIDGQKIVGESDLPRLIARHDPGDTVKVQIIRDGKTQTVDVTLGERPSG
ncbi:MAG TPA: trypsin-like peptidase domain-containing protein [Solirubrobacterales bacterium]|jgi:S1-C subfamily serine protease|nr:trypsin-like peptidase domain-containing protein [Solirubrobacterales bacterium]